MQAKKWYLSKTVIFNILALVVAIAAAFGFAGFTPSPETEQVAMVIITIVNLILRGVTKQPISR